MRLTLVRHATLLLEYAGSRLVVDPMLDPAGARPPIDSTPNQQRNPLVDLPAPAADVVEGLEAVLVTHLHQDHLDPTAIELLDKKLPLVCQREDVERLEGHGFRQLRPLDGQVQLDAITVDRTGGEHGRGELARLMAPVSGLVLRAAGEPVLYVTGDTVPCQALDEALDRFAPDVVVVNGSGARFLEGEPIVMTADEIVALAARVAPARVVV